MESWVGEVDAILSGISEVQLLQKFANAEAATNSVHDASACDWCTDVCAETASIDDLIMGAGQKLLTVVRPTVLKDFISVAESAVQQLHNTMCVFEITDEKQVKSKAEIEAVLDKGVACYAECMVVAAFRDLGKQPLKLKRFLQRKKAEVGNKRWELVAEPLKLAVNRTGA